jgi:hypothetical protein
LTSEYEMNGALTIGDRLERIEKRLDTLIEKIATLAEEADLRALGTRFEVIERDGSTTARQAQQSIQQLNTRISVLETADAVAKALQINKRMMIGMWIALAGWGSVILALIAYISQKAHP